MVYQVSIKGKIRGDVKDLKSDKTSLYACITSRQNITTN